MKPQYLTRQTEIIPLEVLGEQITVIGAGAIGSFTVLQLAKLGFERIHVIDMDDVSEENMSCQFFRISDIGKPKVEALRDLVRDFTSVEISIHKGRYERGTFTGILITAVDSMEVRERVLEEHAMNAFQTKLIIDPRMGAESLAMHCYRPTIEAECEAYKHTTTGPTVEERCTAKATMYTVNLIAGLVAKTVKDFCTGKNPWLKRVTLDVPTFAIDAWTFEGKNPNMAASGALAAPPRRTAHRMSWSFGLQREDLDRTHKNVCEVFRLYADSASELIMNPQDYELIYPRMHNDNLWSGGPLVIRDETVARGTFRA